MKVTLTKCFVFLSLFGMFAFHACQKDDIEELEIEDVETTKSLKSASNLIIKKGMKFNDINNVLNSASSGDIVYVQSGTYFITGKISLKRNITLQSSGIGAIPIFKSVNTRNELLELSYTSDINYTKIIGIRFSNIRFKISDAKNVVFRKCVFEKGKRKPGTDKKYLKDAYIEFLRVSNALVTGCKFRRSFGNSGRGIYNKVSQRTKILNNIFTGYFTTAINENSKGTLIRNNQIYRRNNWVNVNETDHGIYAHSFTNLKIINNKISGWPAEGCGGSVKARNGRSLEIRDNKFTKSGVILYVYNHATQPFLKDVKIVNNIINIDYPGQGIYYGIGYWRNTTAGSEESIQIRGNILPNGSIHIKSGPLNARNFNLNGGGVYNNDFGAVYLKSGIYQSGNY